ncbi:MAG: CotH kinase family protein, partial [Bacteroidota bacterium]
MFKTKPVYYCLITAFMLIIGPLSAQHIAINEIVSSNQSVITDEDNSYEDWIEIYNYGSIPVNLNGFGLTDDTKAPFKWKFPNVNIAAGQYLLIWASDKNRTAPGSPLHTNFKISASGETIVLTRADSIFVDAAEAVALPANLSYGRRPDGTGTWKLLATPTPNASNVDLSGVKPPVLSHASGLYANAFSLTMGHTSPTATIVYTLDGSEPDINNLGGASYVYKNQYKLEQSDVAGPFRSASFTSIRYTAPVPIYNRSAEQDKYTRMNSRQHPMYTPPQPVRKCMVVKAKAYEEDEGTASETVTRNFFVWPQGNPFNIPVISLQIQETYLFDYFEGVYTAGEDFDTWRANNPANNQWYRPEWGNYWRSGKDWEYPVHVEIFEPENFTSVVSRNGGFRIHGNNSRALAIKSLRLYARDEGNFEFDLFKEKLFEATKPGNREFKRIMLRGEGTGGSVYYDVVFNRLMQPVFSGVARIKPAIHFINGEYWGITAIRDRFDEHHYALNYGLNPDNIVSVDCGGSNCEIDAGDAADFAEYMAMREFIRNNDMANETNFARADSMLCMRSFIDHMVLEIFAANDSYERSYWKVRTKENNGYGDGKWRMNVQDFEASFKTNTDWLAHWADITNSPNEALFGNLLANHRFRTNFINRFADLLNTAFIPGRFKA